MDDSLVERREETFDLLVNKGISYSKVVDRISRNYDITESGVKSDISRMDDWLPKIIEQSDHSREDGKVRLHELKSNRERLQRMAMEAQRDDDLHQELQIRRKIEDSIELEVALRQSLGLMEREPSEFENAMADFATGAMQVEFPDPDDE
ncbi:MAG: hypothetical protein SV760_07730 [Halobacteria archaeon]|nr:hypothetical protein [Halobacteria archaeon]